MARTPEVLTEITERCRTGEVRPLLVKPYFDETLKRLAAIRAGNHHIESRLRMGQLRMARGEFANASKIFDNYYALSEGTFHIKPCLTSAAPLIRSLMLSEIASLLNKQLLFKESLTASNRASEALREAQSTPHCREDLLIASWGIANRRAYTNWRLRKYQESEYSFHTTISEIERFLGQSTRTSFWRHQEFTGDSPWAPRLRSLDPGRSTPRSKPHLQMPHHP